MSDLISRQAAIEVAKQHWYKPDIAKALEDLPSAQPERKTGRWINHGQYADFFPHCEYRCSVCDHPYLEIEIAYNFCPNCGAKMEQEERK